MSALSIIAVAIGGCLALEGAAWAIIPSHMREMYRDMLTMDDRLLHRVGLVSVAIGVIIIALAVR